MTKELLKDKLKKYIESRRVTISNDFELEKPYVKKTHQEQVNERYHGRRLEIDELERNIDKLTS